MRPFVILRLNVLREELECWIGGDALCAFPQLESFFGELRFGWSADKLVGSGHAKIERKSSIATYRSETYDSFT